jgi:hypothetical protein
MIIINGGSTHDFQRDGDVFRVKAEVKKGKLLVAGKEPGRPDFRWILEYVVE